MAQHHSRRKILQGTVASLASTVPESFPTNSLPLPPGSMYDLRDEREVERARLYISSYWQLGQNEAGHRKSKQADT